MRTIDLFDLHHKIPDLFGLHYFRRFIYFKTLFKHYFSMYISSVFFLEFPGYNFSLTKCIFIYI